MSGLIERVDSPRKLRELEGGELELLAQEIRERLCEVVNLNGGHLASNLGVVELTIALHAVFDFLEDRLLWDVSHQTYCHKILTGRNGLFGRLRLYRGCCGFNNKAESPYDLFDAGHAGTSVSAALGMAVADRQRGRKGRTVAVIGDASIAAGMAFEAMNHAGDLGSDLLVVLNDNRMSIDHSVGALSRYLNRIRSGPLYRSLKRDVQVMLPRIPLLGKPIEEAVEHVHEVVHHALVPGQIFEDLGFRYFGPVDGHDLFELMETLRNAQSMRGPVLLHLLTEKGHGFGPAQDDPVRFHASSGFLPVGDSKEPPQVRPLSARSRRTFSEAFGEAMTRIGTENHLVQGITAAMPGGTCLLGFKERFPERFFDVGIAEQHASTFASGLARGGLRPVLAVYSSFLQRGYDQVVHDVCLQGNPVVFALDRAGLVADGPTHHGVYDISYLRAIPRLSLAAPADAEELEEMLRLALERDEATAIRYARSAVPQISRERERTPLRWGRGEILLPAGDVVLLVYGSLVVNAMAAARVLADENGVGVGVVNMRFCRPLDVELLRGLAAPDRLFITLEEHAVRGGFGSCVLEVMEDLNLPRRQLLRWGVPDRFVGFGERELLLEELALDPASLAERVLAEVRGGGSSGEAGSRVAPAAEFPARRP